MRKVVISVILWLSAIVAIFFMNLKQISQHQDVSYDFELQHVGSNDMQLQSGKYNITGADAFLIYDLGEDRRAVRTVSENCTNRMFFR
ncbi:MAG: hypothetical protein HFH33_07400 [Eubacterium sp.]|nr:hypothetical protein [Eubacterium sp.]